MVAESYRAAARAGFSAEFWNLTPYETGLRLSAYSDHVKEAMEHELVQAWYTAAFSRAKKLPKLDELLKSGKPRNLSEEIKAAFASLPKETQDG